MSRAQIERAVQDYLDGPGLPTTERMRYEQAGYAIHDPGQSPSYMPLNEWDPDSFIAIKDKDVKISLIIAKEPGQGSWKRLLKRLRDDGMHVTVVEPFPYFIAILLRQGFTGPHMVGHGFEHRRSEYRDNEWVRP